MPSNKSNLTPPPKLHHQWSFNAIGTHWWIGLYEPLTNFKQIQSLITGRIEAFDKSYSRFRADSLVTHISKQAGDYHLPDDANVLLDFYRQLYRATDGLVTPLIGGLLSDAGYDADYSLQPGKLRPVADWDNVLSYNGTTITTSRPLLLDFGAAGKGYLVDLLCELLLKYGVQQFCVDASGDMRCHGLSQPLRIGLEQPSDTRKAIGVVELNNRALCASAPQRRSWAGYHHIMNPRTQRSTDHLQAVWVVADSCMLADGLTTALFFVSPSLLEQFTFEYLLLYADNSIHRSADFPAEVFTI